MRREPQGVDHEDVESSQFSFLALVNVLEIGQVCEFPYSVSRDLEYGMGAGNRYDFHTIHRKRT